MSAYEWRKNNSLLISGSYPIIVETIQEKSAKVLKQMVKVGQLTSVKI